LFLPDPALKRWAIIFRPYGTDITTIRVIIAKSMIIADKKQDSFQPRAPDS
jgi:hypothetical protein